jgi:hypothetical protein
MLGNNIVDSESIKSKSKKKNKILHIQMLAVNCQIYHYWRRANIAAPSSAIEASAILGLKHNNNSKERYWANHINCRKACY